MAGTYKKAIATLRKALQSPFFLKKENVSA